MNYNMFEKDINFTSEKFGKLVLCVTLNGRNIKGKGVIDELEVYVVGEEDGYEASEELYEEVIKDIERCPEEYNLY